MMKEYTDSIAFAMVSARSRQLSDDLFKIAHGTTLACETRRHFHFGFLELIGKTTCDIVNRLNGTIVRPAVSSNVAQAIHMSNILRSPLTSKHQDSQSASLKCKSA